MSQKKLFRKKVVIYTYKLDLKVGGIIVLHKLAQDLIENKCKVMLYTNNHDRYQNEFCNKFATLKDIDNNTIVVYPEVIEGNPLKAKHVVRWILCDLGIHCSKNIYKTWSLDDLVFHFSTFNSKCDPRNIDLLYTVWIDQAVKNNDLPRNGSCYLFKKASSFHKNIRLIHPMNSVLIDNCSNEEIINIFNSKEYFYCYDPYSFYASMAALCGCIPIVYPINGISKLDWLKSKAIFQPYLDKHDNISGIAYGINDIQYAKNTIQNVSKEKKDIVKFGKKTIINFIDKVDTYFFKNRGDYQFKTVERMADVLGWNMDDSDRKDEKISHLKQTVLQKSEEISHLKQTVLQKSEQISQLKQTVLQKSGEIDFIKSSKFFKTWQKYNQIKKMFFKRMSS
mgnify:CR=1 FL=1